jgi:hypothetical protein
LSEPAAPARDALCWRCGLESAGRSATSRRRKEQQASAGLVSSAALADRRDYFRRALLGIVTALLVARPLVAGEDPGRLNQPEVTSSMILNLCWLVTAIAAAIWLARSPRKLQMDWPIFLGLTLVSGLLFLSTMVAKCYRHPAWLISSEFAILPVLFLMIRQLAADEDPASDSAGGLLRAMLASFVSLAAFGIYQAIAPAIGLRNLDLPVDRTSYLPPGSDFLGPITDPVSPSWEARSTLQHPSTLLALLLLGLPCVAVMAFRDKHWKARSLLTLAGIMLIAMVLAGAGWWREEGRNFVSGTTTSIWIVNERPIFGAGPGNFDRHSPRLQPPDVPEVLHESGQTYSELASTAGVACALALVALLAVVIWNCYRPANRLPNWEALPESLAESPPRWEFYLGGALGLVLGLGLRINDLIGTEVPRAILYSSIGAVTRALIWFIVFSWLDGIPSRGQYRQLAMTGGLVLIAVFGIFSGALLRPVVLQLFWVFAALALTGAIKVVPMSPQARLGRWVLAPLAVGAAATFLGLVCDPCWRAAGKLCDARQAARFYPDRLHEVGSARPYQQPMMIRQAADFVRKKVLASLYDSVKLEPTDEIPALEAAGWERALWELNPNENSSKNASLLIGGVRGYDAEGVQAIIQEFHFRLTVARFSPEFRESLSAKSQEHIQARRAAEFREAEKLINEITERDPALEARLRFRLIEALLDTRDRARIQQAYQQMEKVKELDANAPGPRWRLTDEQRERLAEWPKRPVQEAARAIHPW